MKRKARSGEKKLNKYTYVANADCSVYEPEQIKTAIEKLIKCLGGIERYIQPGQKVAVKPNLIAKKKPNEAVTIGIMVVLPLIIGSPTTVLVEIRFSR